VCVSTTASGLCVGGWWWGTQGTSLGPSKLRRAAGTTLLCAGCMQTNLQASSVPFYGLLKPHRHSQGKALRQRRSGLPTLLACLFPCFLEPPHRVMPASLPHPAWHGHRIGLPCPVPCCYCPQERKAGVEGYAEKLAAASRRAERMVKEFEEMGAGKSTAWGGEGVGACRCRRLRSSAAAAACCVHARKQASMGWQAIQ